MVTTKHICDICKTEFTGFLGKHRAKRHERNLPVIEGTYDGLVVKCQDGPGEYYFFVKSDSINGSHEREYLVCRAPAYSLDHPEEYSTMHHFRSDKTRMTYGGINYDIFFEGRFARVSDKELAVFNSPLYRSLLPEEFAPRYIPQLKTVGFEIHTMKIPENALDEKLN